MADVCGVQTIRHQHDAFMFISETLTLYLSVVDAFLATECVLFSLLNLV